MASYSQIKTKIQPLDVIFFRGADEISKVSRYFLPDGSDLKTGYSHAGLVITSELLPSVKALVPGRLYVWESTYSGNVGAFYEKKAPKKGADTGKFGVQIRDLEEVLRSYAETPGSEVAWGRLKENPWRQHAAETKGKAKKAPTVDTAAKGSATGDLPSVRSETKIPEKEKVLHSRRAKLVKDVETVHQLYKQRIRAADPPKCLACCRATRELWNEIAVSGHSILSSFEAVDTKTGLKNPAVWLFCSELAATVLQKLGLATFDKPPYNANPIDLLTAVSSVISIQPEKASDALGKGTFNTSH